MSKKVKFLSILTALSLAASMGVTAFAANNGEVGGTTPADNGTQVWAGVAVDAPEMHIKVTVPTLFAFVVNGTADAGNSDPISVAGGGLLLPNVKVTNVQGDNYNITTVGETTLRFENFSTSKAGVSDPYKGLAVEVSGSIRNEGSEASRNGWSHVGTTPGTADTDVKKYQLVVGGQKFLPQLDGSFGMNAPVEIEAPVVSTDNLDPTTNLAKAGTVTEVPFSVNVGGTRGDYSKAEASAKIGTISWSVSAEVTKP